MLCRCSLTLVRSKALITILFALIVMLMVPAQALGMGLKVVGNQLILSGSVLGDEPGKVRDALATSPGIETVILHNSPGGNAPSGYQMGQLFRERRLHTALSGYCYSWCSRMFLGGSTRYFADDYLPESNNVGFHGNYDRMGHLDANKVRQFGLRAWIIKYSDPIGKNRRVVKQGGSLEGRVALGEPFASGLMLAMDQWLIVFQFRTDHRLG
jgi:hypothetical protein